MCYLLIDSIDFRVFKRAARINAQRLILVGNTEWKKGMVSVKILSSGEQSEIKIDELE
jgi:histidyl-tRNA synthetase